MKIDRRASTYGLLSYPDPLLPRPSPSSFSLTCQGLVALRSPLMGHCCCHCGLQYCRHVHRHHLQLEVSSLGRGRPSSCWRIAPRAVAYFPVVELHPSIPEDGKCDRMFLFCAGSPFLAGWRLLEAAEAHTESCVLRF